MIHRMNDSITLKRSEMTRDERNRVKSIDLPTRTLIGCVRDVQSAWERIDNDPVEWEYKASLSFRLHDDVRKDDVLSLNGWGDFFVVEVKPGRRFLSVIAIQEKRGDE